MRTQLLYQKSVSPHSRLAQIGWPDAVLPSVAKHAWRTFLLPQPYDNGEYVRVDSDGTIQYQTERLSDTETLWNAGSGVRFPERVSEIALMTSLDLHQSYPSVDPGKTRDFSFESQIALAQRSMNAPDNDLANCLDCRGLADELFTDAAIEPPSADSLIHADLHPGNVLFDKGRYWVIDLENLMPGPAFTDMLYTTIWSRSDIRAVRRSFDYLRDVVGRDAGRPDVCWAAMIMLGQAFLNAGATRARLFRSAHWLLHEAPEALHFEVR